MAVLLSPVYTEALKVYNPSLSLCSRSSWRMLPKTASPWTFVTHNGKRRGCGRVRVAAEYSFSSSDTVADDYYAVLGLLPDATPAQIKKAYYNCMKACHPDLSGNDPETTNFCTFINEVYAVLSDPVQRMVYDEIHGYSLTSIFPFLDDSGPKDHAFVDEFSCIAPDVFAIEEDFGRARVYSQFGKPELVQQAIDSCPVDCIHWTSAAQLSLLEDEMRRMERVNVALMLSGMGSASNDVFRMASSRWEKRQAKVLEQVKLRMMMQKGSDKIDSYWDNLWGKPKDYRSSGAWRTGVRACDANTFNDIDSNEVPVFYRFHSTQATDDRNSGVLDPGRLWEDRTPTGLHSIPKKAQIAQTCKLICI